MIVRRHSMSPSPPLLTSRRQQRGPLLPNLWYQFPWKAIGFESTEEPGETGDMPFCALESRNSGRSGHRLRLTAEDALDVMIGLREELEVRLIVWLWMRILLSFCALCPLSAAAPNDRRSGPEKGEVQEAPPQDLEGRVPQPGRKNDCIAQESVCRSILPHTTSNSSLSKPLLPALL